ncbi:MAG: Zn-ribbon domain-containing OB-fold protein [Nitrososphaerales archaeon]
MEKIASEAKLGVTKDHIPLQYTYTAGVAGERFLQLLRQGKLQASYCKNCNKLFLPPKIFCKDCFTQLNEWRDVKEDEGIVYSFTVLKNDQGKEETVALVKYDGVEGGILSRLKSSKDEPRIGMKVKPVFKSKEDRKGDLSDILHYERVGL